MNHVRTGNSSGRGRNVWPRPELYTDGGRAHGGPFTLAPGRRTARETFFRRQWSHP